MRLDEFVIELLRLISLALVWRLEQSLLVMPDLHLVFNFLRVDLLIDLKVFEAEEVQVSVCDFVLCISLYYNNSISIITTRILQCL